MTEKTTIEKYAATICSARANAVTVPYQEVSLDGWVPKIADCHANVDRWVEAHPECQAVRGWITYMWFGPEGVQLTAHSVVRDATGALFDITPVHEGADRGGEFVEHQGDPALFFELIRQDMRCPSLDPVADERALKEAFTEWEIRPNEETDNFGGWYL